MVILSIARKDVIHGTHGKLSSMFREGQGRPETGMGMGSSKIDEDDLYAAKT